MPTSVKNQNAMSEAGEERIYGLIEIAERQQSVAQNTLEGMVKERIAFGQELQRFTDGLTNLEHTLHEMMSRAILETRRGAQEAGMEVAHGAVESLQTALDDIAEQAEQMETILRTITDWLRWRFLWMGLAGVLGLVGLWWLATCAVLWWDTSAIGGAQMQKVRLQTEIAQLEANREAWVKAGMESTLSRCGPKKRPCVKVDESAGSFGEQGNYRFIDND
jgi:hypothetical protein